MVNTNIAVREVPKVEIFKWWLILTKPHHRLSNREIEFVSLFLEENYYLNGKISDKELARQMLFSTVTRAKIMTKLGMTVPRFNNMLSTLRNKGVFGSNFIVERFVPNLELDAKDFRVIFQFKLT